MDESANANRRTWINVNGIRSISNDFCSHRNEAERQVMMEGEKRENRIVAKCRDVLHAEFCSRGGGGKEEEKSLNQSRKGKQPYIVNKRKIKQ